jgi:hypothetical protein
MYYASKGFQDRAHSLIEFIRGIRVDLTVSQKDGGPFMFARPQSEYLTWEDGSHTTNAVVRLEHVNVDWPPVAKRLGIRNIFGHDHKRWSGNGGRAEDVYTPEAIDIVRTHEAYVIETFGYEPPALGG